MREYDRTSEKRNRIILILSKNNIKNNFDMRENR